MHFRVFLKDQPYGVVIYFGASRQGRRNASTLPYQETNPDGVIGGINWAKVA